MGLLEPVRRSAGEDRRPRTVKTTIRDLDLAGRRVFVRVDFNVPLNGGVIGDDTRIRESLPTIRYARDAGARAVIVASHLGRPGGKPNVELSLKPVAARLGELLGSPVVFAPDCVGPEAERAVDSAPPGGVVLLENLRFHPEEENDDPAFGRALAARADVYVDDAFGAAHRAHASVDAIVRAVPEAAAGLLMDKELRYLGEALGSPARPFVAVLGGAKVSDKIDVIENLVPRIDRLLIGGAMAYTFFKAMGKPVGRSLVEDDKLDAARNIMTRAQGRRLQLLLPLDHVVAERIGAGVPTETLSVDDGAIGGRMGLDIGPRTVAAYAGALRDAQTVVWNGPMGVFEIDAFAQGTIGVATAVAAVRGTTIVGGGDSIAAIRKAGVADRITHISTGGGASLEFLGGRTLPGVAVLPDA
ncbi:MAG: phosphoglycerate kinase [Acidobacteria bacterium]|nr:phosphoglycerate kinase [Acidobacteriota bacterium]